MIKRISIKKRLLGLSIAKNKPKRKPQKVNIHFGKRKGLQINCSGESAIIPTFPIMDKEIVKEFKTLKDNLLFTLDRAKETDDTQTFKQGGATFTFYSYGDRSIIEKWKPTQW